MERAEDRVGLAGLRAHRVEVVDGVQPRMREAVDAVLLERAPHALDPAPGERARVGAEVDLAGLGFPRESGQLALGRPTADHEQAAEPLVQVAEALEHELRARPRGVPAPEEAIVEAEHRHDALGAVERGAERGMVVHAQVAREPDEGGHLTEYARKRWVGCLPLGATMAETLERFPLFPLGLVLIPHELVPLHIFEERYKLMIGECIEHEREFGIVWLADDGLKEIGCAARISRVLERFDDGRMNVLVEGSSPFRLLRRIEDLPYPAGDVELLEDTDEAAVEAAETARRRYADLVAEVTDERPEPDELARLDAYGMAATLDVALEAKQMLLELRSERGRLEQLEGLFAEALARIRHAERAAERARGNGSVRG